jgi:HEAT repeat protein
MRLLLAAFCLCLYGCSSKPYEGKTVGELEQMLHDPNPAVQVQGAFGLSRLGPDAREAVPGLIASLEGEALVRQNAALALGAIGPEAKGAVPALIRLLSDPEWTVRRQAATALGQIGPDAKEAVKALEKLHNDKDRLVRKAAEEAKSKITVPLR